MNSDMRQMIDQALEDTISALLTLLTYVPNPYRTVLLPVPTLQAFLSRTIGLLECLPEIHKSTFHRQLEEISTEFSIQILPLDDYLMLRHLRERSEFQEQARRLLELFQSANLIHNLDDSWDEMRKISWETNKYPSLVEFAREQEKQMDIAKEAPLDKLLEKINEANNKIASYQGHRGERETIIRHLKYPEIHTTSGPKARSLFEKTNRYLGKIE